MFLFRLRLRALESSQLFSVESDDREGSLVTFEDVTTISDAEELIGKTLLVEEDCLPEKLWSG